MFVPNNHFRSASSNHNGVDNSFSFGNASMYGHQKLCFPLRRCSMRKMYPDVWGDILSTIFDMMLSFEQSRIPGRVGIFTLRYDNVKFNGHRHIGVPVGSEDAGRSLTLV